MDQQEVVAVKASMQEWARVVAEVARDSYRQGWLDAMSEKRQRDAKANVLGGPFPNTVNMPAKVTDE